MIIIRHENIWETWDSLRKSNLINDYVTRISDRNNRRKDYGTGELYTAVEAHLLLRIYQSPGTTVTDLANETGRTKSAISQVVKKLEQYQLINRAPQNNGKRKSALWVTPKGKHLCLAHIKYDSERTEKFLNEISKYFTSEQMDAFFKIMEVHYLLLSPKDGLDWINK